MLEADRRLVVVLMVAGVFILVTLSETVGVVYFAMAVVYAVALNQDKNNVIEFIIAEKSLARLIIPGALAAVTFLVLGNVIFGTEQFFAAATFYASSFVTAFTIDNPLIRLIIFGVFVPIVETLFFYGVIMKYLLNQANVSDDFQDKTVWVIILMVGAIATAFHFVVRGLNDAALLSDILFFSLSGVIVIKQRELSGATVLHLIINTFWMATLLALIPRFVI